jgi:hypothetical protein
VATRAKTNLAPRHRWLQFSFESQPGILPEHADKTLAFFGGHAWKRSRNSEHEKFDVVAVTNVAQPPV